MNKHELFHLIGEADETYVSAADQTAKRAKSHWRTWAACAACAALILGVYPAYRAFVPGQPPLHGYTVAEGSGGGYLPEQTGVKAPHQGGGAEIAPEDDVPPIPEPTEPPRGDGPDGPVEEGPYNQYNSLLENAHLDQYPEWYGGTYNNYEDGVPVKLVVCIVDGFRTPELEAQITNWCGGGELIFQNVKYSRGYLQKLMERLSSGQFLSTMEADKAIYSYGIYEDENCIRMDCNGAPNDATLAALAQLDPDGDAIQVRVFAGQTVSPDIVKGSAPAVSGPTATPVPGGAQPQPDPIEPTEDPIAVEPEGARPAQYDALPGLIGSLPAVKETSQPAP